MCEAVGRKLQGFGWVFLTDVWDKETRILTGNKEFHSFLNRFKEIPEIKGDNASTLILDVCLGDSINVGDYDLKGFDEVICVSEKKIIPDVTNAVSRLVAGKLGYSIQEAGGRRRYGRGFYEDVLDGFYLKKKFFLFLNEEVCTHIIDSGDKVAVNLFFEDLANIRVLGILKHLPHTLKHFIINVFSGNRVLVYRRK